MLQMIMEDVPPIRDQINYPDGATYQSSALPPTQQYGTVSNMTFNSADAMGTLTSTLPPMNHMPSVEQTGMQGGRMQMNTYFPSHQPQGNEQAFNSQYWNTGLCGNSSIQPNQHLQQNSVNSNQNNHCPVWTNHYQGNSVNCNNNNSSLNMSYSWQQGQIEQKKRKNSFEPKKRAGKKKKRKGLNEPQRPVSAYALFFRDTQVAIKADNSAATFGEISKLVASMWDNLSEDAKQIYKQKTENAKRDYLKQLAAYRANMISKGSIEVEEEDRYPAYPDQTSAPRTSTSRPTQCSTSAATSTSPVIDLTQSSDEVQPSHAKLYQSAGISQAGQHTPTIPGQHPYSNQQNQPMAHEEIDELALMQIPQQNLLQTDVIGKVPPAENNQVRSSIGHSVSQQDSNQRHCIREGCSNLAVSCAYWGNDYCSNECVYHHCRDAFTSQAPTANVVSPALHQ